MQVITIIGDIVASRALKDRAVFQRRLGKVLSRISADNDRTLASPYTITLGDEFQAVYRKADGVFADLFEIMAEIHPVHARMAIGVGELATRLNPTQALGMDGPAFHEARATLTALKTDGRLLRIGSADKEHWALANHLLNLLSHQLEGWTQNRLQVIAGLLRGREVKEIEEKMNISRVAIYKNIRAAALDEVVGVCHELERAINRTLRNP
jgi:hypothetical protein